MGMPGQSRAEKFLFDKMGTENQKMGPVPIYSAITQQHFTEYPAFCYKARNLLTSKEKEFLIRLVR